MRRVLDWRRIGTIRKREKDFVERREERVSLKTLLLVELYILHLYAFYRWRIKTRRVSFCYLSLLITGRYIYLMVCGKISIDHACSASRQGSRTDTRGF